MKFSRHRLFGLSIDSEIPLPDLPSVANVGPADVLIRYGTIPRPDGIEVVGLYISGHGAVLNIWEAGRYMMKAGQEIVVEPNDAATERSVRLFLLGSAFGVILHQRRLLPLHANAIDFGDVAVAFMGHSGAGKSTLANWFHDRGLPILGDDVCVVRDDPAGTPIAEAGIPRIRLWRDALQASGRDSRDYEASFDDMDKYDVPIAADATDKPLRLAAIYSLSASKPGVNGSIDRLTGVDAVETLVANTYRGSYIPMLDGVSHHLAQCVALARRVPVFALQRRWGLEVFTAEAAQVEKHVRALLEA